MSSRIFSFPPIIDKSSEILILGSIPGKKSLEKQEYYAHPQNKFWKIIFELFNENDTDDYAQKITILKKYKIALWDVIDSCERKGSLDSEIKNQKENEIENLLQQFPKIKVIFCNGGKSYKSLQKILSKDFHLQIITLPSTSPAHARLKYEEKLVFWNSIKNYLS